MARAAATDRVTLDVEPLRSLFVRGVEQARQSGEPALSSAVLPIPACDPIAFFRAGAALSPERWLWVRAEQRFGLVGVGTAWSREQLGEHDCAGGSRAWRELISGAQVAMATDAPGTGPVAFAGFSFDPARPRTASWEAYPDGLLALPRLLLTTTGDQAWLTINRLLGPDADPDAELAAAWRDGFQILNTAAATDVPCAADRRLVAVDDALPPEEWRAIVAGAVQQIRAGHLDKVVLARASRVRGAASFVPELALGRLRTGYPSCYVFAVARGEACFLGASPEQLAALAAGELRVMALAGTIARGATEEEDRELGQALLASAKNRGEHATVVRAIREGLTKLGANLAEPGEPALLRVRNVQHLMTPVTAQLPPERTILDVVDHLHPTPAVGGYPRNLALALIRDQEQLDRGWYAGAIGWLDGRGEGEFAVALRSALLRGDCATLFAGCGIVADSEPAREYAESGWKLQTMLSALGGNRR